MRKLIDSSTSGNDSCSAWGRFRVKGDVVEVKPANSETALQGISSAATRSSRSALQPT